MRFSSRRVFGLALRIAAIGGAFTSISAAQERLPTIDVGRVRAKSLTQARAPSRAKPVQSATLGEPSTPTQADGEPTALSPVVGYVANRSISGTKTDTPLKEIPQSITVVGRSQMVDQGAKSLQEAVRYAPGVVADLFGLDTRTDSIAIRGQEATVVFLDGMRRFYGNYQNAGRIETYTLERIEVLRGPSSVLYGQSGVGGAINMISKLPTLVRQNEISFDYGSFRTKELRFDLSGPASPDGTWLYRIIGLGRDANTQVDFVRDDRLVFSPAITFRPNSDTSVTLLGQISRDRSGSTQQFLPHEGTLYPGPYGRVPRNRFVGEPNFDRYNVDARSATLLVDHKFDPRWSFHQGFRYSNTHVVYAQIFPYIPDRLEPFRDLERRTVERDVTFFDTYTSTVTSDTNVVGQLDLGPTSHKVLSGFDYSRADESQKAAIAADNHPFDIFSPIYGLLQLYDPNSDAGDLLPGLPMETRPKRAQTQAGLYIQDQIRLGPWIGVFGLRKDWTANRSIRDWTAVLAVGESSEVDSSETAQALTKRAGLMYEFSFGLTPYASYAESFVPVAGVDFYDKVFKPLEGRSIELGFKYQRPGTNFVINGAVYDATEKNRLQADPDHPGFSIQTNAKAQFRGFEIEGKGDITPEIKLIASYSLINAKYQDGDQAGFHVESIPRHQASAWATYTFNEGPLQGFSFGGGARRVGSSWDGYDVVRTPGYTLFDGMAAYEIANWRWSLNATNIGDRYYLTTCLNRGDCFLGARRRIITTLTLKF